MRIYLENVLNLEYFQKKIYNVYNQDISRPKPESAHEGAQGRVI